MINKIFALPVNETISPVISRRQLDDLELDCHRPSAGESLCGAAGGAPALLETRR